MQLGYSHPIEYAIPSGISIEVDKQNNVTIKGIDKQVVGQVAAELRAYRKPDHYKGKGVRYADEYIRIKAGKSA
jgi:large subunit ribosomal protein L6